MTSRISPSKEPTMLDEGKDLDRNSFSKKSCKGVRQEVCQGIWVPRGIFRSGSVPDSCFTLSKQLQGVYENPRTLLEIWPYTAACSQGSSKQLPEGCFSGDGKGANPHFCSLQCLLGCTRQLQGDLLSRKPDCHTPGTGTHHGCACRHQNCKGQVLGKAGDATGLGPR